MGFTLHYTLLMVAFTVMCWAQAPEDAEKRCTDTSYPDNEVNLMDSYNYEVLLPRNGTGNDPAAVWNDYSFDKNDVNKTDDLTYWQYKSGGLCRSRLHVCGRKRDGVTQNNWLFTQHIGQVFDPNTYNYDVTIHVLVTFSTPNCRGSCKRRFNLLNYKTDSIQAPSTEGNGYMNPANYQKFAEPRSTNTILSHTFIFNFTLPPSHTGFYIAAQETGSCITLSHLRVYRNNCKSRDIGLVKYPSAPAPVSGMAAVRFSCVANAEPIGADTVGCTSQGTWAEDIPQCGCLPGYQINTTNSCEICPVGHYQPLVSASNKCRKCPPQSSAYEEGAAVCECDANYIRLRNRPDDPCLRSPSAPLFDLTKPPELEGVKVTAIWQPPTDSGGDPGNLYYDVYASQLMKGQHPTFCRQNEKPLDNSCNGNGTECRYELTKLNSNTPYAILVVSANSVTDDPECISNLTALGSRYVLMVVGTEDTVNTAGVSSGGAMGVTVKPPIAIALVLLIINQLLFPHCS